jgi:hypothetical protein
VEFAVAFAQAKLGNTEQSQKLAVALNRPFSEDTTVQRLGWRDCKSRGWKVQPVASEIMPSLAPSRASHSSSNFAMNAFLSLSEASVVQGRLFDKKELKKTKD